MILLVKSKNGFVDIINLSMPKEIVILLIILFVEASSFQCQMIPGFQERIDTDLSRFDTGIPPSMISKLKSIKRRYLYTVRNGKMTYQVDEDLQPNRAAFYMSLAPNLPDMQFAVSTYDQPRVLKRNCNEDEDNFWQCTCDKGFKKQPHNFFIKPCSWSQSIIKEKVPLFSYAILSECFYDLLFSPIYLNKDIKDPTPWDQKIFKVFWRGTTTGGYLGACDKVPFQKQNIDHNQFHRSRLIHLCRKIQDCDAEWALCAGAHGQDCQEMTKQYGMFGFKSMKYQSQFKVIIDIDGNSNSDRFSTLLSSGSAIIKIATFMDINLIPVQPWVHYIPVKIDLTDLHQKILWAKNNQNELRKIAQNGKNLFKNISQIDNYRCYLTKLLIKYASLLVTQEQYQLNEQKKKERMQKLN